MGFIFLRFRKLDEYPTEEFTEVYLIKYERINNARSVLFDFPFECLSVVQTMQ